MEGTYIYEGTIAENPNTGKVYIVAGEHNVVIDLNEELCKFRGEEVLIRVASPQTKSTHIRA